MLSLLFAAWHGGSRSFSSVIGGSWNTAVGENSLAAGKFAFASDDFSAVLGFRSGSDCHSMGIGTVNVCVVAGGFFVNGEMLGSTVNVTALEAFDVNAQDRLAALEAAEPDARLTALEECVPPSRQTALTLFMGWSECRRVH